MPICQLIMCIKVNCVPGCSTRGAVREERRLTFGRPGLGAALAMM